METNSFFFPAAGFYFCLNICAARAKQCRYSNNASARCFDCATLAQHDRGGDVSFRAFYFTVIPSEAEESRGNGLFMFCVRFREMFRQAQHDTPLSFRAKSRNLVETKDGAEEETKKWNEKGAGLSRKSAESPPFLWVWVVELKI